MNNIFIINRVFYDSDSDYNAATLIGYTVTEDLAIQKVADLNRLHKEVVLLNDKLKKHVLEVILPSIKEEEYEIPPQYPKWRDGIHQDEITVEMRAERNRIIKLQQEVLKRNNEKSHAKFEQIENLKQKYIDSLCISSDVLDVMIAEQQYKYNNVICYKYEKIEELK
jgi:hypothetical protein